MIIIIMHKQFFYYYVQFVVDCTILAVSSRKYMEPLVDFLSDFEPISLFYN